MREAQFSPVRDNQDKRANYARQVRRYQRAIREGFYLEALLIDGNIIEDRLRAVLYHAGLIQSREDTSLRKEVLPFAKQVSKKPYIGNISGTVQLIKDIFRWAAETDGGYEHDRYLTALKAQCESADVNEYEKSLDDLKGWLNKRNDIVHALMRRNADSVEAQLPTIAETGRRLANDIDEMVRVIKKNNRARRAAGL